MAIWVGLIAGTVMLFAAVFLLIKVLELAKDIRRIEFHADRQRQLTEYHVELITRQAADIARMADALERRTQRPPQRETVTATIAEPPKPQS